MRNKRIADILLIVLLFVFAGATAIKAYFGKTFAIEMLCFVTEAALVGGIADWFAVTALFKKPLGFPWHTAIIPRNRERVIDAITNMVENDLLSRKILNDKIQEMNIIDKLIAYIDKNIEEKGALYRFLQEYSSRLPDLVPTEKLASYLENIIKTAIREADLSKVLGNGLKYSVESIEGQRIIDEIAVVILEKVKDDRAKKEIRRILAEVVDENVHKQQGVKKLFTRMMYNIGTGTDAVNIDDAALSIQQQMVVFLNKVRDRDDEVRSNLIRKIKAAAEELTGDEQVKADIDSWKMSVVDDITISAELNNILVQGIHSTKNNEIIITWLKKKAAETWQAFKTSEKWKKSAENYLKILIYKILKEEHRTIGVIAKRTLAGFTDEALNSFVEKRAGNDLHWIRINGCLVGAVFGAVVFLILHFVYMPLIKAWM